MKAVWGEDEKRLVNWWYKVPYNALSLISFSNFIFTSQLVQPTSSSYEEKNTIFRYSIARSSLLFRSREQDPPITNSFSCYTCISCDDDDDDDTTPFPPHPLPAPSSTNRCSASVFFLFIFPQPHLRYRSQHFFVASQHQVFLPSSVSVFHPRTHDVRVFQANELWLISRNDVYWLGFIISFFANQHRRGPRDKPRTHRSFLVSFAHSCIFERSPNSFCSFSINISLELKSSSEVLLRFITDFCFRLFWRNPCHEDKYVSIIWHKLKSSNGSFSTNNSINLSYYYKGIWKRIFRRSINFKYTLFHRFRSTNDC